MHGTIKQEEEDKLIVSEKPKLELITGGKGGGPDHNWLSDLSAGTVFIARHKSTKIDNPVMEVFEIKNLTSDGRFAFLVANVHVGQENSVHMYVDTLRFSRGYDFGALLGTVEENG